MLAPVRLTAALAAAALLLGACGRDDEDPTASAKTDRTETATTPAVTAPPTTPAPDAEAPGDGCRPAEPSTPEEAPDLDAPEQRLDASKRWTVRLQTSCGRIDIRLDVKENPKTASSFAALVRRGFYDGLTFHRVANQPDGSKFVIQGGDPAGDGSGGPGYSVVEAPPRDQRYTRGVVAMAKTQIEDPGTSGSQFFIVTAQDSGLPAEYAVVGRVTGGDAAVRRISDVEVDPATDMPAAPVVIEKATLLSK